MRIDAPLDERKALLSRLVPLRIRDAQDPTVAGVLWIIVVAGLVAIGLAIRTDFALKDGLPVLGGLLVLLTAYFAARTLRGNEFSQAVQMLATKASAVQVAGVLRLAELGRSARRDRETVPKILTTFERDEPNTPAGELARKIAGGAGHGDRSGAPGASESR